METDFSYKYHYLNTNSNAVHVSKLFAEMIEKKLIEISSEVRHNRRIYKRNI